MHPCSSLLPTTPQKPSLLCRCPASHYLHFGFHEGVPQGFHIPVTSWPFGVRSHGRIGWEELAEEVPGLAGFLFN